MNYPFNNKRAKYIKSTNKNFSYLEEKEGKIFFDNIVLNFDYSLQKIFHTSYIKKISIKNNKLIAETRNSIYEFELIEPIEDYEYEREKEETKEMEEVLKRLNM